ncbi:exopolysaccharide biosynthesis protein [Desulfonema ishimotonii]|uniref:Exopolysaccharide biosynthesis protein n=1 Tax=Desulfonema ishimotonii TaxID=45657 RepID=A0A401FVC5_9BACT|nr:CpsD/CapB family tyrosine-protein kinase [Desulfonema ishimotonii]GBC60911.1 exopolysaccharide biosynthesis protein [Desulfonema ishimotonii]
MSKLKKALEKAMKSRLADERHLPGDRQAADAGFRMKRRRCDVQVTYSQTQVQSVDARILERNRVLALFQEYKTTEQIKRLRTQVLNQLEEIGGNSLLVTSANPGEGKTFTSINLGVSIAQEFDRTVLIVDADLKNPTVQHYDFANDFFNINVNQGLADYLQGHVSIPDLLLNPGIEKLTIIPGGHPLPNSAELLGSPRMEALVKELTSRYRADRIIIFDAPALLYCTDPVVLSRFVDGILLVVEEEKTSKNDLKKVLGMLKGKKILGTILNKSKSQ